MSEFFIQGIQDAKRDASVIEICVSFTFYVYKDHLGYYIDNRGSTKKIYFQSYGLRNLNPSNKEILNMGEAIQDLLIPKIRNAMPFDKDIGAKVIPDPCVHDYFSYIESLTYEIKYTATNGNFSHNDW